ncbi:TetR/AcrR family transcriptional regulator [Amycolatopsis vastitatis]|uniref:TetR family transcriptional regulator n=1 Tax=Amycolatopsis vastitatis TaxID=1905142 RepID=A0A229SS04_9PSEU|nr:TetR/AcrR family transcriptional regulator [Amycolatopsis vastitatis]OXM61837.1 TetR family transcriptional regulator [Amycolatopsis vastitatis]
MARPRSFDEAAVLRAARDQFWETGYAGTKVDDIAAVTGLGKGSLYGAFGDKHALFLRVYDHYCAEATEGTRRQLEGPDETAYRRLGDHVRAIAESVAADQARRGCLIAKSAAECAEHDEAVAARTRRVFGDLQEQLAACIAGAQRAGDIDAGPDPAHLAGLVLAVLRGLEALGKGGVEPDGLRAIAETALAVLPRPVKP